MNFFTNDAYQLSMLYAHWKNGHTKNVVVAEAYFRKFNRPSDEGKVVMAGAYRISELLYSKEFTKPFKRSDMKHLKAMLKVPDSDFKKFSVYLLKEFAQELSSLEVKCARDGEPLYWDFPVVQVKGSPGAVHMMETLILGILNRSVRAATIARRIRSVAGPKMKLLDFSTRRDDPDAAVHTGVAAFIGGFDATSNMEAGRKYGIPVSGTMAHSYVLSYGMQGEMEAFKDFLTTYPESNCLLVDTFDIGRGIGKAIGASISTGIPLKAIRIDSGDPFVEIPRARQLLDKFGFQYTKIVASGDFDEDLVFRTRNLPIDVIGIGSSLGSPDWSMGFVYKFVAVSKVHDYGVTMEPVMKITSSGKNSLPGEKVWRATSHGNSLTLSRGNSPIYEVLEPLRIDPWSAKNFKETMHVHYFLHARNRRHERFHQVPRVFNKKEVQQLASILVRNS